jgi:hypothetical protein
MIIVTANPGLFPLNSGKESLHHRQEIGFTSNGKMKIGLER